MVYSLSGYKTLSATQLANLFVVMIHNLKSFDAFRLLCAYLYLEAKQEATERSLRLKGCAVKKWQGPSVSELRAIVGGRQGMSHLWQCLEDAGLISRSGNRVTITETPLPESSPFLGLICGVDEYGAFRRSIVRAVPIPHEWFYEWAGPTRSKVVPLLHLFYCAACLSFKNQKSGEVKNGAAFKFEQLVHFSGLNRSRLTLARRRLLEEGRITPDKTRYQRKLNRDGHYASVHLSWYRESKEVEVKETGRPAARKCSGIGRPHRDKKQASLVGRNQKPSGVFPKRKLREPSPHNVQSIDLRDIRRLKMLFAKQKWLKRTEANFLFFVSAAVKANSSGNDPSRLFVWLVSNHKKDHVSQAHEDAARHRIARLLELEPVKSTPKDQHLVHANLSVSQHSSARDPDRIRIRQLIAESLEGAKGARAA